MITFKTLRYKNFQSTGNHGIIVQLDRSESTLIGGKNGSGKSTVLESLSYVLFGKPLKKVNLGGLINTINRKNMVVEVEFEKNGHEYKIIRGDKPKKFEFYIDGELLDQSANSRDYQSKIEYILGMDFKLFTQIVVLNKEKYVPFMELSAADRRKVVEDILDISVFSVMSNLVKEDHKLLSNEINDLKYNRSKFEEKINGQKRLIAEAESNVDERKEEIRKEIVVLEEVARQLSEEMDQTNDSISDLSSVRDNKKKVDTTKKSYEEIAIKFKSDLESLNKTLKFYESNDNCPTCKQVLSDGLKSETKHECTEKSDTIKENVKKMMVEYEKVVSKSKDLETSLERLTSLTYTLRNLEQEKRSNESSIASKTAQLNKMSVDSKVDEYKKELNSIEKTFDESTENLEELMSKDDIMNKCKVLLKDDGIKASIVKDYIGFINKLVNEYLCSMEFYLDIQLDENFNDKINSIKREGFCYDNLSTGQKCRVNLAIWMALLEVASVKNSVVSNILFLDEILEPMDSEGVSLFMKLVKDKLKHKNLFVVSQRYEEFADNFRSSIKFKLVDDFTEVDNG